MVFLNVPVTKLLIVLIIERSSGANMEVYFNNEIDPMIMMDESISMHT
jgi:hypothetical protein